MEMRATKRETASARSPYVPRTGTSERRRLYISLRDATSVITYTSYVCEVEYRTVHTTHELAPPYNNIERAIDNPSCRRCEITKIARASH